MNWQHGRHIVRYTPRQRPLSANGHKSRLKLRHSVQKRPLSRFSSMLRVQKSVLLAYRLKERRKGQRPPTSQGAEIGGSALPRDA